MNSTSLPPGDEPEDDSLLVSREVPTLRQQVTDKLRQAIVDQRFPPGTHLVERELCQLLGVSRTSVREALRHLESERLIRNVPHKGPVVASITPEEAQDIYQVRAALEGLAGELFATNATPEMVDRLRQVAGEIEQACRQPDPNVALEAKSRLYDIIFEGARNPVCMQVIESLNARIWLLRRLSISAPGRASEMMEEIRRIVDAAAAGDPEATRDACVAHVECASAVVRQQLAAARDASQSSPSRHAAGE